VKTKRASCLHYIHGLSLSLVLLISTVVFSQQEPDFKSIYYNEQESDSNRLQALKSWIWQDFIFKHADSARMLIEEGKQYAESAQNLIKLVEFTSFSGILSSVSGEQLRAIDHFEEALVLLEGNELEYQNMVATLYNNMGNVFSELGNIDKAIDMYTESLKVMMRLKNYVGMGNAYNNIANLHKRSGQKHSPIKYYRKAYSSFKKANNYIGLGNVASNIIAYKIIDNELDSALYYCELALQHYEKINNNIGVSLVYSNLASIYSKKKDYTNALIHQNKSIDLIKDLGNANEYANGLSRLAAIYLEMGELKKADELSEEAFRIAKETESVLYLNEFRHLRYEVLKKIGDTERALYYLERYIIYKDSINDLEREELLTQKKYEYEYAKKTIQDSIARAEHDKIIQQTLLRKEAEIKQRRQQNIFFGILAILVLGTAIWTFRRLKISQKQTKIIESQKAQVEEQRNILDSKNREIMDSINYAKRLQDAILPSKVYFQTHFDDHFIFYKPKDVVSGDFYWLERIGNELYLAAADCTGHGVPGAMVSVVCSNALTKAVLEEQRTAPSDILGRARDIIVEHFGRGGQGIYDGMDVALIKVVFSNHSDNKEVSKIVFAGAHNPFWMVRNGKFTEIKGDSQPVGNYAAMKAFNQHEIKVEKGDVVYLFSDGYMDQFGGENLAKGGKKYKRGKFRKLILELSELPMQQQKEKLSNEIEEWMGDLPQTDDIVIIGLKF
jgi:serine phosphatase RsbU (regulator of sigma subunit)